MSDYFELPVNGKTYTLRKNGRLLKARMARVSAYAMKETQGYSDAEVTATPWLQALVGAVFLEHLPPVIWDMLSPQDKQAIGTLDDLQRSLDEDPGVVGKFWLWANEQFQKASDFLESTPGQTAGHQPEQTTSMPSSAVGTDGPSNIANPSAT